MRCGAGGTGFYRNPGASWNQSNLVQRPSWRVNCTAPQQNLTPAMSVNGLPQLGTSYSPTVSDALPNTFAILISQRVQQFGLLRSIGMTGRQLTGMVLIEALITGVVASLIGIAFGFGIALLLESALEAFGIDLPTATLSLAPRTVIVAMVVGVTVTVRKVSEEKTSIRANAIYNNEPIEDPEVYQNFFVTLERALFAERG